MEVIIQKVINAAKFPILRGRLLKLSKKGLTVTAHRFPILRGRLLKEEKKTPIGSAT